jgi:hypothetical protein
VSRFHEIPAKARKQQRRCKVCTSRFLPRWVEQQTCSRICRIRFTANTQRGSQPRGFVAHVDRRRAERKRQIEAWCQQHWPELSVREIAIFNFAVRLGYNRGYGKGYHRGQRIASLGRARKDRQVA